jgi:predicted kinase
LIVLAGLPCTGKTTLGRELAATLGTQRISTDIVRRAILGGPLDFSRDAVEYVFDCLVTILEALLARGESVICEGLFLAETRERRVAGLGAASRVVFLRLVASPAVLLDRLSKRIEFGRNSEGDGPETLDAATLMSLVESAHVPPGRHQVLDTSTASPMRTLRAAVEFLQHELRFDCACPW